MIVGYLPEIYFLIYNIIYKNKKKKLDINFSNSIWVIWIIAAIIYIIYASVNKQYVYVISNLITTVFCLLIFILKKMQPKDAILPIHQIEVYQLPSQRVNPTDIAC